MPDQVQLLFLKILNNFYKVQLYFLFQEFYLIHYVFCEGIPHHLHNILIVQEIALHQNQNFEIVY